MADKEEKSIRVVDRRMFTPDGELRPDFVPEEPPAPTPLPAAPPAPAPVPGGPAASAEPPSAAAGGGDAVAVEEPAESADGEEGEIPEGDEPPQEPRGAFSAIVRSLATTAYSALGLLNDPAVPRHRDPAVARQMIDWLAILESKTRNNLSFEESDFLSRVLYELRLAFVEVTRPPDVPR